MVKRKFKNIYGKQINVLTKPMKPEEILEFDVPTSKKLSESKRQEAIKLLEENGYGDKEKALSLLRNENRNASIIQEIKNLLAQKYIEEMK